MAWEEKDEQRGKRSVCFIFYAYCAKMNWQENGINVCEEEESDMERLNLSCHDEEGDGE